MKNLKLVSLKLTRTALISFFGAALLILFAATWRNNQGVSWNEIWSDYLQSYAESALIFVITITLFVELLMVKKLHIKEQLDSLLILADIPLGIGITITMLLIIAFFAQMIVLGLVTSGEWSMPGMTSDQVLYICMGLAAFFGLCGRGVGLTYVVLTAGIAAFVTGSLSDYVALQLFLLVAGLAGWFVNRIIYLIFFHKWSIETETTKKETQS
jgi:hypothetical protein